MKVGNNSVVRMRHTVGSRASSVFLSRYNVLSVYKKCSEPKAMRGQKTEAVGGKEQASQTMKKYRMRKCWRVKGKQAPVCRSPEEEAGTRSVRRVVAV